MYYLKLSAKLQIQPYWGQPTSQERTLSYIRKQLLDLPGMGETVM